MYVSYAWLWSGFYRQREKEGCQTNSMIDQRGLKSVWALPKRGTIALPF